MLQKFISSFLALVLMIISTSCGHIPEKAKFNYMNAYHEGKIEEATSILDKHKGNRSYQKNNNALWFSLENASLHFINGQIDQSIEQFKHALEASDYFLQEDTGEKVAKLLLSDEVSAFSGEDFEQVLLRVYFAFALIQKGDTSNGLALLKQAETYTELREHIYAKSKLTDKLKILPNSLAKYFLALFLENQGDTSNASILYKQARGALPYPQLKCIDQLFPKSHNQNLGTVIFVCHNGNSPYRVSVRDQAAESSLFLIKLLLEAHSPSLYNNVSLSDIPKIPVPKLVRWPHGSPVATSVLVGKSSLPLTPFYNVDEVAHKQLQEALPLITARASARYLIRNSAVELAKQRDEGVGQLLDFGMVFANILTQADTRSWMTLPYSFDLARIELAPGTYPITVKVYEHTEPKSYNLPKIKIDKGDICIVHLFNIHPNVFRYLVPPSFMPKENLNEKN